MLFSEIEMLLFLVRDRKTLSGKSLLWNCEILFQNFRKISNDFNVECDILTPLSTIEWK